MKKETKFMSISELSELLERGESSIRRQIKLAGLKQNKDKKYNIESVLKILEEAKERDKRNSSTNPNKDRKTELECKILEAKLSKITGESISKTEHIQILLQSHQIVKQELINLLKETRELTSEISVNEIIKKRIAKLCNDISDKFKTTEITEVTEKAEIEKGKDATITTNT